MSQESLEDLVAIAKIAKPRGLRGEVIADILTDFPERFETLETVLAVVENGKPIPLKVENSWFQKGRIVLKFAGYDTLESVEFLRNATVCVDDEDVVDLEEGEFFDWELQGCDVHTIDNVNLGTVKEVMRTGGTEIIVVDGTDREYLIPFAESICVEVDIAKKLILVDPPEGLLEL